MVSGALGGCCVVAVGRVDQADDLECVAWPALDAMPRLPVRLARCERAEVAPSSFISLNRNMSACCGLRLRAAGWYPPEEEGGSFCAGAAGGGGDRCPSGAAACPAGWSVRRQGCLVGEAGDPGSSEYAADLFGVNGPGVASAARELARLRRRLFRRGVIPRGRGVGATEGAADGLAAGAAASVAVAAAEARASARAVRARKRGIFPPWFAGKGPAWPAPCLSTSFSSVRHTTTCVGMDWR